MEKTYVIAWESKFGGTRGQGKKLFSREEANQLADELNRDYPEFVHRPLNLNAAEPEPTVVEEVDFTPASDESKLPLQEAAVA